MTIYQQSSNWKTVRERFFFFTRITNNEGEMREYYWTIHKIQSISTTEAYGDYNELTTKG